MKSFIIIFLTVIFLLSIIGCAGIQPIKDNVQKEFTYDYVVDGKTKSELWKNARNYFAAVYGDFTQVARVMDENEGTIIGKGLAPWYLLGNKCGHEYHIRFMAKDGKARLQLELIPGVPPLSDCTGYPLPSEDGYQEIIKQFKEISLELEKALKGESKSTLNNF
jgi:hypothetical protein